MIELGAPRLEISDLESDEWVAHTFYDPAQSRIYAAYDNSVNVFHLFQV
jgi:hypothetical protein